MSKGVVWGILFILVGLGCMKRTHEPPRPKQVPSEAVWAGGADGGSFIACTFDEKSGSLFCKIYNDFSGVLVAEGHYNSGRLSRPIDTNKLKFSGFDGKRIYLSDGLVLTPESDVRYLGK